MQMHISKMKTTVVLVGVAFAEKCEVLISGERQFLVPRNVQALL